MKFTTIENVVDWKAATLLKYLCSIKIVYTNKNIFITTLCMDNKFEVLRNALQDKVITLNTTAANEHVPQIERKINVLKEQVRSTTCSPTKISKQNDLLHGGKRFFLDQRAPRQ